MEEQLFLLAGFEPFGGRSRNRSWEVVQRFRDRRGFETILLPVDFARLQGAIASALADQRPAALLLIGESPKNLVGVEQIALNVMHSNKPDNAGRRPSTEAIIAGAPLALPAIWDAPRVARTLIDGGIPAQASFHAGSFVCNAALYHALHAWPDLPIGFLHVPRRPWPSGLRLTALAHAVELAAGALLMINNEKT